MVRATNAYKARVTNVAGVSSHGEETTSSTNLNLYRSVPRGDCAFGSDRLMTILTA